MKRFVFALLVLALTGCDSGGGSSSGSNAEITDSNTSSAENIGTQFAGTYKGTIEGTYTATELGLSDSDSSPVTIVIDSNGNATVSVDGRNYTGSLDSDSITARVNVNETSKNITCTGTVNIDARISGNTISGEANGAGECRQGSLKTPVKVAGVLKASK